MTTSLFQFITIKYFYVFIFEYKHKGRLKFNHNYAIETSSVRCIEKKEMRNIREQKNVDLEKAPNIL
jgi:hypothetical protein